MLLLRLAEGVYKSGTLAGEGAWEEEDQGGQEGPGRDAGAVRLWESAQEDVAELTRSG